MTIPAARRRAGVRSEPPPLTIAPRSVEFGPPPPPRYAPVEIGAIVACALALSVGLILLISGYFASHDPARIAGVTSPIGQAFRDQGDRRLTLGMPTPSYDSDPPTSGAHLPAIVTRQFLPLSDSALLSALAAGDVVIMYGGRAGTPPPAGLSRLAAATAGPFSTALAAAGQAVILARRPGTSGLIGLAWTRMVRVSSAGDPLLRRFVETWLGRGAPARG